MIQTTQFVTGSASDGPILCLTEHGLIERLYYEAQILHDCRHPGLVQSVLAPVMGITNINLQYSPGAKRIDVLARYSSHNKEGSKYSQKSKVNLDSLFQDSY